MSAGITDTSVTDITVTAPRPAAAAGAAPTPAHAHGLSFHAVLSALNPLQLIPVVGSIYRAVTGDEGDPTVRFFGSIAVSALTGGPIGVGINLLEKVTGIDPEAIVFRLLGINAHHAQTGTGTPAGPGAGSPAAVPAPAPVSGTASGTVSGAGTHPAATGWTAAQLQAYGVRTLADGSLVRGAQSGADVLNGLELTRLARMA